MANVQKVDLVNIDLNTGNIHRSFFSHAIGLKDNKGDAFGVRVFRDGEAVDLTDTSVQGVFMPPQGSPIAITSGNSVSGNEAYVVLPQACYDYEGQFTLAIKLVGGGVTGTMRIVDGIVSNTHASGTVAPTSAVPTYQEVLATYDDMVAATAAANGAIAATYSSSSTYKVGDYCIHDGGLYRCTTAITTAEVWTSGHWTAAKIAPDVSDLKSAFEWTATKDIDNTDTWEVGSYAAATGNDISSTTRIRSNTKRGLTSNILGIRIKSGYEALVYAWTSENTYVGCMKTTGKIDKTTSDYAWVKEFIFSEGYIYKFVLRNANDTSATMTTAEASNCLYIVRRIDNTLSNEQEAADAKRTGQIITSVGNSYSYGIKSMDGCKPVFFMPGEYYTTPTAGNASVKTLHNNWASAKIEVQPGDKLTFSLMSNSSNISVYAWLDSSSNVIERYGARTTANEKTAIAPSGAAYVVLNNRLSDIPYAYYALIGEKPIEHFADIDKSLCIDYPTINTGNFSGSNIWNDTSTSNNIAKTVILENLGNCVVRSTIKGLLLTIYTADEEGTAESGSSSLLDQQYNSLYIPNTYNFARIRIQPGYSGITDFSNYIGRLLVIEYPVGIANRLSLAERNIVALQQSGGNIFDLENVTLTEGKTYSVVVPEYNPKNIVAHVEAKYTGTAANEYLKPGIAMKPGWGVASPKMHIGGKDTYKVNDIRFYPLTIDTELTLTITIYVPTGLTLEIRRLQISFDNTITRAETPLRIDAHSGFRDVPSYSKRATEVIAQLGAFRSVQLPKRSSDGVWFCYHDDTFNISDTFLRNADGTVITESEYNNKRFSEIPFSYLDGLDWGVSTNEAFAGEKPQLISEFFQTCAKTGIHPMLSFHPASQSTAENFAEIKAMAKKYGVLDKLTIKTPASSNTVTELATAFSVFGYEIEGYTANVTNGGNVSTVIANFDALNIDKTKVICCIEQFAGSSTLNETAISNILSAGYEAGIAQGSHTRVDGTSGTELTATDYEYFTSLGVTTFTSATFASYGLNW